MRDEAVGIRILRRAGALFLLLAVIFFLLVFRIFAIQVFDFERYQEKVLEQLTTESPVRAARGEILDSAGRVLAANVTVYRVSVFPNVVARHSDADRVAAEIVAGLSASIEGVDEAAVRRHLDRTKELERTVAPSVDRDTAVRVLEFVKRLRLYDMVAVEAVTTRHYPYGSLASHALGFTGSDGQGLYGMELRYNTALSGVNGSYITARDSTGNEMPNAYKAYVPAVNGSNLHTTIDAYVQAALEEQLENAMIESGAANRACGIVMDVKSGAVLAMATAPSFDLNSPFELNEASRAKLALMGYSEGSDAYEAAKRQLLLETWSNKAATEIYMPGSTFKIITTSAAVEEGVVKDLREAFYCGGSLQVADRIIHCHKREGHGSLTFEEGLQNSCNPVMMTLAQRLGCDTFYEYVKAFGFLEKTGIDLPGEGNSIFHAASDFTTLDLATASFGQNFKVSVLQLITAVCAVANGGELREPYLVEKITDENGNVTYEHKDSVKREVISRETSEAICRILAEGVAGDGGAKNAYVAGYRIAAKTGTSEKIGDNKDARISSCVAFAPAKAPEVAMIIVVDEPTEGVKYGSVVAAPYVANTMGAILPYLGVEPQYTEEEAANLTLTVPDCTGWSEEEAARLLSSAGISYRFEGEGGVITAQSPQAGSVVLAGSATVTLTLGEGVPSTLTLPSLVGMTAEEANKILLNLGVNIKIKGPAYYLKNNKTVIEQFPSAGETVQRGSVVILHFPYDEIAE